MMTNAKGGTLATMLVIGVCCRPTQAATPIINVEGGKDASGYQFSFEACRRSELILPIDGIEVITYAESREDHTHVCQVDVVVKYGMPTREWRYGTVPH